MVQLGMILPDRNGKSLSEFCALIRPDGWVIGEGAFKVHGKTLEMCEKYGVHVRSALGFYRIMAQRATFQVAHNAKFDSEILAIENEYCNAAQEPTQTVWSTSSAAPWQCTMEPNAGLAGGKSLKNCLQHYCKRSLGENAHDAMFDVKGCKDIFFAMKKLKEAA